MEGQLIDSLVELERYHRQGARARVRSLALDGLAFGNRVRGVEEALARPRVQFLYIHHVLRDEEAQLERLMGHLAAHFTFIPYSEGVQRILENKIDKPYLCFSSDDGFKNNLRAGAVLKRYGATACFFVNPGMVGETSFGRIKAFCAERLHFPPVAFLDWDDIHALQRDGHEIGGHTMLHSDVGRMAAGAFAEDCREVRETLAARCGEAGHFAFPYGRFVNFNEQARRTVFASGHVSCASAERGCHVPHGAALAAEDLCIRRDHILLGWKLAHIMYFMVNNSRTASPAGNLFPYARA